MNYIDDLLLNTEPIDKPKAVRAVNELYKCCGRSKPITIFVNGPQDLQQQLSPGDLWFRAESHNDIARFVSSRGWGRADRIRSVARRIFTSITPYDGWSNPVCFPDRHAYRDCLDKNIKWKNEWEDAAGSLPKFDRHVFSTGQDVPSYQFDLDLRSNTWEGLLEKWARFSFEWLGMGENPGVMP